MLGASGYGAYWPGLATIAVAVLGLGGAWVGWKHRSSVLSWFRRGAGPAALTVTLQTIEALSGRVDFLHSEVARLSEEGQLLRRENDQLRELVTSKAAISALTDAVERLAAASEQHAATAERHHAELLARLPHAASSS